MVLSLVSRIFGSVGTATALPPVRWGLEDPATPRDRYALLDAYYRSLGLYSGAQRAGVANATWLPALKAIRNVAARVVEFHAAHLWPGTLPAALPIATDHEAIIKPIQQIWTWSNWAARKQVAARWLALYGDLFLKVVAPRDAGRVYFQLIKPAYVSDFDMDERGYLTYIRVDIPRDERRDDRTVSVTHTEVWDKERYRLWVHERGDEADLARLGTPREDAPLRELGIDFVPFVHAMFRDTGEERGTGAFWTALEKIDEANLQATRLSQMLFRHNNVTWALEGTGADPTGRPIPPPSVSGSAVRGTEQTDGTVVLAGEAFLRLPSNWAIKPLVPALQYDAALSVLQDMMRELEMDLPELAYARITEAGGNEQSGRALRFRLTPAIDRVIEARGNAEAALIRADQMALTLGAKLGLFPGVGTYEAGDFDHSFVKRAVIPTSKEDEALAGEQRARTAALLAENVSVAEFLRIARPEWDEEKIAAVLAERKSEAGALGVADAEFTRMAAVRGAPVDEESE